MQTVLSVLRMAWGFFADVQCPFLGISFASLFLGIFAVNISIRILKPLLGIGGSINRGYDKSLSGFKRQIDANKRR